MSTPPSVALSLLAGAPASTFTGSEIIPVQQGSTGTYGGTKGATPGQLLFFAATPQEIALATALSIALTTLITNWQYAPSNVLRYGADLTGSNDSTQAFQYALWSVSYIVSPTTQAQCLGQGGKVYVPRGVYKINSTLYLNANVHIVGEECGPLQESPIVTTPYPGAAVINYTGPANSIAFDTSGFWLVAQSAYTGTASAGSNGPPPTITISTGLMVNTAGAALITITGGTGAGQTRPVIGYISGTGVVTVGWPWNTVPDATSTYSIPGHAVGDRVTQLFTLGEFAVLNNGVASFASGAGIENLCIVASANQYMGVRFATIFESEAASNLLISGFKFSMEATGCGYSSFKNITSSATNTGFAWIACDHLDRELCQEFGVSAVTSPITASNAPWFNNYLAQSGIDPNSNYFTGHYCYFDAAGTFKNCDAEGADRSWAVFTPNGTVFSGCHLERWTYIGFYINNGTALWLGGDFYPINTTPAFSGINCYFTIDSAYPIHNGAVAGVTIGSFPNTFGGRVTVRNIPAQSGDAAPVAGSLVSWDAFPTGNQVNQVTTVGNGTLSGGNLYGGFIAREGTQSTGFTDTTDTAPAILQAMIPPPVVGSNFITTIANNTTQIETLSPGAGVAFFVNLLATPTIAAGASRNIKVIVTSIGIGIPPYTGATVNMYA